MAAGLFLTTLQGLAEACEAIGLALHRYRLVSLFRGGLSLAMYGVPLLLGFSSLSPIRMRVSQCRSAERNLCGRLMLDLFRLVCRAITTVESYRHARLPGGVVGCALARNESSGYCRGCAGSLGHLGIMLGETAVGLYGLVQRTTAIVELAWAPLSKLLLKSYAETAPERGVDEVRSRMVAASD